MFLLGASLRLSGQTVTLAATADTTIKQNSPNQNSGAQPTLILKEGGSRVLIRFDPSAIVTAVGGGSLASARLRLYVGSNAGNWGSTGRTVDIYRIDASWTETGATWNCADDLKPGNGKSDCLAPWYGGTFEGDATDSVVLTNATSGWIEFDVTADVTAFLAGTAQNGWLIEKTDEGQAGRVDLASKEAAPGLGPQLVLLSESATVDMVPPTLGFVSPDQPFLVNTPTPTISLAYHDGGSGVDTATLHIALDGQDLTASCSIGPQSASCAPPPLLAGSHSLVANIRDLAGNVASASKSFELLIGPGLSMLTIPVAPTPM